MPTDTSSSKNWIQWKTTKCKIQYDWHAKPLPNDSVWNQHRVTVDIGTSLRHVPVAQLASQHFDLSFLYNLTLTIFNVCIKADWFARQEMQLSTCVYSEAACPIICCWPSHFEAAARQNMKSWHMTCIYNIQSILCISSIRIASIAEEFAGLALATQLQEGPLTVNSKLRRTEVAG